MGARVTRRAWEAQGLQGRLPTAGEPPSGSVVARTPPRSRVRAFLFCDTSAWTALQSSLNTGGCADARLHQRVDATMDDYVSAPSART